MAELGFASAILRVAHGPMDDVAIDLARNARTLGAEANPLQRFTSHVMDAERDFTLGTDMAQNVTRFPEVATPKVLEHFRSMVSSLDQAAALPVRHEAMGHATTARAAAKRVIAHLEAVPAGQSIPQPKIGESLFMDMWEAKHGIGEALNGAGMAHVLGNW
jgi:hypothetical protein